MQLFTTDVNENYITLVETINGLIERVTSLEAQLNNAVHDHWMVIDDAAKLLGQSVSAVRQRLRHPTKPMPQGKVWKQDGKGCRIYVNPKAFRKYM
ncbi:hypothetical protein [Thalassotalea maritima]|uniref:hypothetical protein n=1 Tax=Thalassotalea maritima TaxID=3242416 RepID=UPI00352719BC